MNHAQLGLSNDELLSTTRAVRKRLDLERSLSMEVVKECMEMAVQAPTGSNSQSCGLAVGHSIYWETWEKYIKGYTDDAGVISETAERFQKLLKVCADL